MASLNQDGQKKAGRFIKNKDRLMNHVAIEDFSFEEICSVDVASFDNDDSTIIHARLHSDEDLSKSVKDHPRFDQKIPDPSGARRILRPQDFTREWSAMVSPMTGRRRMRGRWADGMELSEDGQRELAKIFGRAADDGKSEDAGLTGSTAAARDEVATVEQQHAGLARDQEGDSQLMDTAMPEKENEPSRGLAAEGGAFKISRPDSQAEKADKAEGSRNKDFIPLATDVDAAAPASVESVAADEWKVRKELEQEMARTVAQAREEAVEEGRQAGSKEGYDAGYRDGFRTGEEKGEIGARQAASQFFGRAAELISEFEGLKGHILDNVQQNFFDLCQAMGEALLEREFEIRPDAFVTIMRRAVAETVKGDQFKVRVNPETAEAMIKAGIKNMDGHIVTDPQIPAWEFKLESQLSVVDVNAKKMVKNLLGQADISLFNKEDKAAG